MKRETKTIKAGQDTKHGIVNTPVYRASTVVFDRFQDVLDTWNRTEDENEKLLFYGRKGTPTQWSLETALTELEGGYDTVLTPSGLSAISCAVLSSVHAGAHLLVTDSCYDPVRYFCTKTLQKFGVETTFYDPCIGGKVADLIRENTTAILCESPGSNTFEVQDIPAIAKVAHEGDAKVLCDNTWASPLYCQPLDLGADMSIQACTKYVVGHSDVLMGSITVRKDSYSELRSVWGHLGFHVSPDDAYLAARGLRTMAVRLERHQESALRIAHWCQTRPEIKRVMYPALVDDPGYDLWKRDFQGATGLMGLVFNRMTREAAAVFAETLELFSIGYSWGGYESLVTIYRPEQIREVNEWTEPSPIVRLHIGLEDSDDLIADLEKGFNAYHKTINT